MELVSHSALVTHVSLGVWHAKVNPQPPSLLVMQSKPLPQSASVTQFAVGIQVPTRSPHPQISPVPHSSSVVQPYTHVHDDTSGPALRLQ